MTLSRRSFLAGIAVATAGLALKEVPASPLRFPVYDFHVHLFGIGDGDTGCRLSPRQRNHWNYRGFLKLLGLSENGRLDQDYVAELVRQLRSSSVEKAVLLAQDARYDNQGHRDLKATNVYVPNEYLFQIVSEYSDLFVPCVSINPRRRDAMEELDRCAEAGARVLKVHPPTQDVNPGEERFRPFYRRLAEHGIILMVHTGSEHASEVTDHTLIDPAHLLPALDEGCPVIAAHAGMGSFLDGEVFREDYFLSLVELIDRFPNLYLDTAVLASMFRWRCLPRILEEGAVLPRLVHASDWPFPSNALVHWNRLAPTRLLSLCAETNLFERDLELKRALGLPAEVFERGAQMILQPGRARANQEGTG
jgi:predicted TIM-barrel fold metal-dependent hydrolase